MAWGDLSSTTVAQAAGGRRRGHQRVLTNERYGAESITSVNRSKSKSSRSSRGTNLDAVSDWRIQEPRGCPAMLIPLAHESGGLQGPTYGKDGAGQNPDFFVTGFRAARRQRLFPALRRSGHRGPNSFTGRPCHHFRRKKKALARAFRAPIKKANGIPSNGRIFPPLSFDAPGGFHDRLDERGH